MSCYLSYSKEQIDNAQTVGAIPRQVIDDAIVEMEEHIKMFKDEGDNAVDNYMIKGLSTAMNILKKHTAEVGK